MGWDEDPTERAIKKSAEGVEPPPPKPKAREGVRQSDAWNQIMDDVERAFGVPRSYAKCRMFAYDKGRDDVLVNFYTYNDDDDVKIIAYRWTPNGVTLP